MLAISSNLPENKPHFVTATQPKIDEKFGNYMGTYAFSRSNGGEPLVTDVYTALTTPCKVSDFTKPKGEQFSEIEQGVMKFVKNGVEVLRKTILKDSSAGSNSVGIDYYSGKEDAIMHYLEGIDIDAAGNAFNEIARFFKRGHNNGAKLITDNLKRLK